MPRNQESKTMSFRLNPPLAAFVESHVGENGTFDSTSEYIRDLIRKDMKRVEQEKLEALRIELQHAFSQPDSAYESLTAEDIITRNRQRLSV